MRRHRVAILLSIIALLLLGLLGITYFLSSVLTPPGTQTIERERDENGLSLVWVRSIYGLSAADGDGLTSPVDLAVSEDGLLYVPQPVMAAVYVFDSDGAPVRRITGPDHFRAPNAVESGPNGRVFVADKARSKVICLDEDDAVMWEADAVRVNDLTWSGERLYVSAYDSIIVLDINGDELLRWGERGYSQGQLDFPRGVVVRDEDVIVADGNNARLQSFDLNGTFLWESARSYRDPASEETTETQVFQVAGGLCSAPGDRVLVTDPLNFDIVALDSEAQLIGRLGSEGSDDGKFWYPSAIVALGNDRYAVSDTMNNRVQIVEITFDDAGRVDLGDKLPGAGSFWCICPTSALVLLIVAVLAWFLGAHKRDTKAGTQESRPLSDNSSDE